MSISTAPSRSLPVIPGTFPPSRGSAVHSVRADADYQIRAHESLIRCLRRRYSPDTVLPIITDISKFLSNENSRLIALFLGNTVNIQGVPYIKRDHDVYFSQCLGEMESIWQEEPYVRRFIT